MDIKVIIAENIIYLRKSNHMTQLDLASKLFYSEQAISKWERGLSLPDAETLYKIANIFNVPVNYLFEKHENPEISDADLKYLKKREKDIKIVLIISYLVIGIIIVALVLTSLIRTLHLEAFAIFTIIFPILPVPFLITNKILHINGKINYILASIIIWSTANAIYANFLQYDLVYVFAIALIIQLSIISYPFVIKKNQQKALKELSEKKKR